MKPLEAPNTEMPITQLRGVGSATAALFARLEIHTIRDLLAFYPRDYEDRTREKPIGDLTDGESVCVRAFVTSEASLIRGAQRPFVRASVSDDTGVMTVMFFNAPYMRDNLVRGAYYSFFGRVQRAGKRVSMVNPVSERLPDPFSEALAASANVAVQSSEKMGKLVPVYSLTAGLSQNTVRKTMQKALEWIPYYPELLPEAVREHWELVDIGEALRQIHAPEDRNLLNKARRRLAFEELYLLALTLRLRRESNAVLSGAVLENCDMSPFTEALPYELTNAQKRVIGECLKDMQVGKPAMHRLVQGDVGSGKTVIAAACAYAGKRSGWQTALMAPTEILAEQHFQSLSALLEPLGVHVGLLTGGMKAAQRREALEALATGMIDLIIGTHALLSENVAYFNLRLAITDEQHRFGVVQRSRLLQKGREDGVSPHMLVMSATPIPRTLALMLYGDLDLSALDELPPGRQPVQTRHLTERSRQKAYGFMLSLFQRGLQGYVVCPHIEDSETEENDITSVEAKVKELSAVFPQYKVEALHGRMKNKEKDEIMRRFASGETTLLVSTTVIEVGVNVPNACMMVIESAERFGLAQLHQLRGRVGRGKELSYCILFSDNHSEETAARLKALCVSNDGFALAQEDLRLRGPGDFLGVRQSGLPALHSSTLGADMPLLTDVQDAVQITLLADPGLEGCPALRKRVETLLKMNPLE